MIAVEGGVILPFPVSHVLHDLRFSSVDLDVEWGLAVCWIFRIGAADIGDLEHHITLLLLSCLLVPEGDAHILHAVTIQGRVFQPVRMDGDFTDGKGVIRYTAGGLIGEIVFVGLPYVRFTSGRVKLSGGEKLHVPVEKTTEGDVKWSNCVFLRDRGSCVFRWLSGQEVRAVAEGVVGF